MILDLMLVAQQVTLKYEAVTSLYYLTIILFISRASSKIVLSRGISYTCSIIIEASSTGILYDTDLRTTIVNRLTK